MSPEPEHPVLGPGAKKVQRGFGETLGRELRAGLGGRSLDSESRRP